MASDRTQNRIFPSNPVQKVDFDFFFFFLKTGRNHGDTSSDIGQAGQAGLGALNEITDQKLRQAQPTQRKRLHILYS